MKIIRTKTEAKGGITPQEKAKLDLYAKEWIAIALRTAPIEAEKIVPAIEGIYAAAKLKKPRVVIVPSPRVMAFAYGASAWIWHCRKNKSDAATRAATVDATRAATVDATRAATDAATRAATDAATYDATYDATYAATVDATDAATYDAKQCFTLAGEGGIRCAKSWGRAYQGGNMWAGWVSYLAAFRDVLGLDLPEHKKFKHYEDAARHGGFRVMHEEFCIVSDFPEFIKIDDGNRPHCENGPSHKWRDGWALYHWHGVKVPKEWILNSEKLTAIEVLKTEDVEQRAAGCEIVGWEKIEKELGAKIINDSGSDDIGKLIEMQLPELSNSGLFLKAWCPRNGWIYEGVPHVSDVDQLPIDTALKAQAWRIGDRQDEYVHPTVRT